jgi:quercetin dioxygenase-like cupin family protein
MLKAACIVGALAVGVVAGAATQDKKAVFVDSAKAEFKPIVPGASMAVVWGDPDKGPSGTFTKFEPGAAFDMHTHTNETRIVVLKGAYIYKPEKGDEKRVGPGCALVVPGGDRHVSGGDAKEGALFYIECSGKFDVVFDKK